VHAAALTRLPVDTARLFDGDQDYALWLESCLGELNDTIERMANSK
jgi:hypothetical protein